MMMMLRQKEEQTATAAQQNNSIAIMNMNFSADASPKYTNNDWAFKKMENDHLEQLRQARNHELKMACLNSKQTLQQCGLSHY
jgi:hypothetical protein